MALVFQAFDLEWWPVSRDSLMYGVAVLMLINVLRDGKIEMKEALYLVLAYAFYILSESFGSQFPTKNGCTRIYFSVMCFNDKVSKFAHKIVSKFKRKKQFTEVLNDERAPLLQGKAENGNVTANEELADSDSTMKDIDQLGTQFQQSF